MMFLDCPAYLDDQGDARCGLPAEIGCRYTMQSTDGPLDSVMIKCPSAHLFNGPVEFLTWTDSEGQAAERLLPAPSVAAGQGPPGGRLRPPSPVPSHQSVRRL